MAHQQVCRRAAQTRGHFAGDPAALRLEVEAEIHAQRERERAVVAREDQLKGYLGRAEPPRASPLLTGKPKARSSLTADIFHGASPSLTAHGQC